MILNRGRFLYLSIRDEAFLPSLYVSIAHKRSNRSIQITESQGISLKATRIIKKLTFYIILICIPFFGIELLMRIFLAIWLDPNIFTYGTGLLRTELQQKIDPTGVDTRVDAKYRKIKGERDIVNKAANRCSNYSKYFPNETRRDIDEKGNKIIIKMNNKGFRGPDIIEEKEGGVIRIVTLGASSTFGFHDNDQETYPYYLQEILNQNLKEQRHTKIKRYEVINLGMPHQLAENIYAIFINEALPLNPDVVTFYEGFNDVSSIHDAKDLTTKYTNNSLNEFFTSLYKNIKTKSILIVFIDNLIKNVFTTYTVADLTPDSKLSKSEILATPDELPHYVEHLFKDVAKRYEAMAASFLKHLAMINQECKKHQVLFIVANQQMSSCSFAQDKLKGKTYHDEILFIINKLRNNDKITIHQLYLIKHAMLMKQIAEWASAENVMFVDIINALNHDRDTLVTNVHLDYQGNKIIAQEFAKKISGFFNQ
jgi:hypothetical protein